MPIPQFIADLRAVIGHRPLWLACAVAVVIDADRVLLARRKDTGRWAPPGGVIEPGEQPADAAARECFEETGVLALPEALTMVALSPEVVCPNGDQVQYIDLVFRCTFGGGRAQVNDDESLEVGWFSMDDLPDVHDEALGWIGVTRRREAAAVFAFSGIGAG